MVRRKIQNKRRAKTKTTKQVTKKVADKKDGNVTKNVADKKDGNVTQTVTVNVPSYQRRAYTRRRQAVKKTVNENPYVSGGAVPAMYPQQQLMRSQLKVISDSRGYDALRGKMDALAGGFDKRFTELSTNVDKKLGTIASRIQRPSGLTTGRSVAGSEISGEFQPVASTQITHTQTPTEMTPTRKFGEFNIHTTQTDALVTQPRGVAQLVDMGTDPHITQLCQGKKIDGTECGAYCQFGSDYCVRHQQYEDKITPTEKDD